MVDHFIVCIDRIIASTACFGSLDARTCDHGVDLMIPVSDNAGEGCCSSPNKYDDDDVVVECRICQEEDQVQAMEAPCSCNGTLKFAHRNCIQRWCNKKGNTICEICKQEFSPNYSLPPVRSNAITAIDIRQESGNNADVHVDLASAEHQLLQTEYEDYAMSQTSSIACLRSTTLLLLIILLVRQALMVTKNSTTGQDTSIIFNLEISLLQFAGVLLPCYAMARSWYAIQNRRRQV
ncbi:hypothetical protein VIGAN_01284800 [Vigna angularis var. angularis]|uniref:RING-CH-type domain-containing protein n=2 Tax=Phaseolus angularis TaxID=3914 RepID=A0A0S3R3A1_PHAAN|nr:uncharacterized protein LOC108325158 [Vigna angularis]BAT75049.1 hypothetical protein VIGAN_01284800 [Vigna angularis var. angularis]